MSYEEKLAAAYAACGIPLDRLPYTEAMDRLVASLNEAEGYVKANCDVWPELVGLRKRGLLPRVGRIRR